MPDPEKLRAEVSGLHDEMVATLVDLVKIPAISPDYGYEGEYDKAAKLKEILGKWPFDRIEWYDSPDERAKKGVRPNLLAYYEGEDPEAPRLWILTHLDVVPPGDLSKWTVTDPFTPVVKDGKVYGRGTDDNGQSVVSSLYAVKALMNLGVRPKGSIVLAFVSDEETGSAYGLQWLVENHPDLFRENDLVLVPDGGNEEGTFIETAEKSILWLKVRVEGKQVHASMPEKGLNAHRIALEYASRLDKLLHEKYDSKDEVFDPPVSTFEPTMASNPSGSPNIVPGEHEVVFDCRILPGYTTEEVLRDAQVLVEKVREEFASGDLPRFHFKILQRLDAPKPTDPDSPIVKSLKKAVLDLRGKEATVGGIGGGTFAAFFRKRGIPAVVWATLDEKAHQPDEYAKVENLVEDARVMASLPLFYL